MGSWLMWQWLTTEGVCTPVDNQVDLSASGGKLCCVVTYNGLQILLNAVCRHDNTIYSRQLYTVDLYTALICRIYVYLLNNNKNNVIINYEGHKWINVGLMFSVADDGSQVNITVSNVSPQYIL